ncbi:sialate:O-sulfotransferase 1-like [Palaemon carinicauda]|uniref:sialate:O-sulfotransferase 1-like n=1 Tax=Palaemon carinicauda TaxID=392227 RepID=UPI0035B5D831
MARGSESCIGHQLYERDVMAIPKKFYFIFLSLCSIYGIIVAYTSTVISLTSFSNSVSDKTFADKPISDKVTSEADSKKEMTYRHLTIDNSAQKKYWWSNDTRCSKYSVNFGSNIDAAWLLSYPRSGNTWTRYLIESASGFFTGSIYQSKRAKEAGYLGEDDPISRNRTIVIKTHKVKFIKGSNKRTLLIMRNPARSIISYWNFVDSGNSNWFSSVSNSSYTTKEFHEFVANELERWRSTYIYPLENTKRLYVIFYELLRENPLREIRGILRFLELRPDEDRLLCLSRHLEGVAKGGQREVQPYTLEEKKAFTRTIEEINVLLSSRGFPSMPDFQKYGFL